MEIRQARVEEVAKVFYESYSRHGHGYARSWQFVVNKSAWRRAAADVLDAIKEGTA